MWVLLPLCLLPASDIVELVSTGCALGQLDRLPRRRHMSISIASFGRHPQDGILTESAITKRRGGFLTSLMISFKLSANCEVQTGGHQRRPRHI
ncbi:hypothetical protein B0H67DRAFT_574073 [Lasiosphaeris hirsuta]|uniref:Secreted protein n=1 Tax=Lasiosphaeris hirsuta TaxID=260670 RepID=A0AA40DX99_9PEZI|nr:hypothetical protein B0H67DRAFT_574073 [Lasiosphaeris hirsuta]